MPKKMGRNDPCPCGSGLKYKKCCLGKSKIQHQSVKKIYAQKYNIRLKEKGEIKKIASQLMRSTPSYMNLPSKMVLPPHR
jgi:hypothetical protein